MTQIIAGRFQTSEQADHAVQVLVSRAISPDRISVFYVTPPGQHDATPVGGDEQKSEGLEHPPARARAPALQRVWWRALPVRWSGRRPA